MDFKQFYKTIQFDIDKEIRTVLQATQGDTKSRGLLVPVVVNSVVTPVTTETMSFFALKPDGTRIMTQAVKDGTGFRIDFTNQTFSVAGVLLCALVLYGTNGEKIADKKFKMTVDSSLEDGAIISEDERGILDRAFDLASDIVPRLEALDVPLLENLEQEVIAARGAEPTLGARLDGTDAQLVDYASKLVDSTNLFDKNDSELAKRYYVNKYTGNLSSSASYITSGFIEIKPNTNYIAPYIYACAFYDKDKVFVEGDYPTENVNAVVTSTATSAYMRVSFPTTKYVDLVYLVNEGDTLLPYEDFYKGRVKEDFLNIKSITYDKTDFVAIGKNLFDKSKITVGKYISELDGAAKINSSYDHSDFIEVLPETNYCVTSNNRIAFYDESRVFISGLVAPSNPIETPLNTKYVRFSFPTGTSANVQFEQGDQQTSYEVFGFKFKKPLPQVELQGEEKVQVELKLPPKIYALVGQELNIYFDNIMNDKDTKYDYVITCSIGKHLSNCFRVTPTTSGTYAITISAYQNNTLKTSVTSSIIVSDTSVGNGVSKKILIIGDSTTANGIAITKLNENFNTDVMNIETIGTKGVIPNKHEGISGWTVSSFYKGVDSPFVFDGVFDFAKYISVNSLSVPDYVVINLGINDVFTYKADEALSVKISTMLTHYQGIIDSIKTYNSTIKVGLAVTIPPAYDQDSFGKGLNTNYQRWRAKRNNYLWTKALIDNFKSKEAQGIYLVPINTNLDTRYNMGLESLPVNARNSKTIESIVSNGHVHPSESGYWQIADIYWYWLKSFES